MSVGPASYGLVVGDLELALRKVHADASGTASDLALLDSEVVNLESRVATLEAAPGGVAEAPTDGQLYGRQSSGWHAAARSVAARTGDVVLTHADLSDWATATASFATTASLASYAPLSSPALTGNPTAPTQTAADNSTKLATTQYVTSAIGAIPGASPSNANPAMDGTAAPGASALYSRGDHVHPTDVSRYAASNPSGFITAAGAPVQSVATRTGVVTLTHVDITDWSTATAGFVPPGPATVAPLMDGTAAVGTTTLYARQDHAHPSDTSRAPLANPVFTGTVTASGSVSTGALTPTSIVGVTSGAAAPAGAVGEVIQSQITSGAAVSVPTSGAAAGVTSISLTAGDWDVFGNVTMIPAGTTTSSYAYGWIGTAVVLPDYSLTANVAVAEAAGAYFGFVAPTQRLNLTATTTVYLCVQVGFSVSTMKACGLIWARRAR